MSRVFSSVKINHASQLLNDQFISLGLSLQYMLWEYVIRSIPEENTISKMLQYCLILRDYEIILSRVKPVSPLPICEIRLPAH